MELSEKIESLLFRCLFKDEEISGRNPPENAVMVDGIINRFAFHPQRIMECKDEIVSILKLMPTEFFKSVGGGWSTLNLCNTASGEQWGEHRNVEMLVVLGIGCEMVKYTVSKNMWNILPGGMPYVVFEM